MKNITFPCKKLRQLEMMHLCHMNGSDFETEYSFTTLIKFGKEN